MDAFLSSIIQVAIGVGGFAGIIAAVRQRNVDQWAPEQRVMLQMLLTASAASAVFSLIPWLLFEAEIPPSVVWPLSSGILMVWQTGITIHRVRQLRATGSPFPIPRLLFVWVTAALVLQVMNLFLAKSWPYLLGVLAVLANAFTFFLVLLFGESGDHNGGG